MPDLVLDTNILSELLSQYFVGNRRGSFFKVDVNGSINQEKARVINNIILWHESDDIDAEYPGLIIASSFGFVEIGRKFEEISHGDYSIEQFAAFIEQPPQWFFIATVELNLFHYLKNIPPYVEVSGRQKPVEWADAIHVATGMSRDSNWLLAATDERIKAIPFIADKII